jgi:hypothetical protein
MRPCFLAGGSTGDDLKFFIMILWIDEFGLHCQGKLDKEKGVANMRSRVRHIQAFLFGGSLGLGVSSPLFVTISGGMGWLVAFLMTLGAANATLGVSFALTNHSDNRQINKRAILVALMGNFLMGVSIGISLYEMTN